MHRHHIVPRHMGGTDEASNLTPPISIAEHADLHRLLWEEHGLTEDFIAWQALSGRMTSEKARLAAAMEGQKRSLKYRESRSSAIAHARAAATRTTCAKGGTAAAPALTRWQQEHREVFLRQCAANGKAKAPKQRIPHVYLGIRYASKRELQDAHHLSQTGFYGKLRRGEIVRLDREIERLESLAAEGVVTK